MDRPTSSSSKPTMTHHKKRSQIEQRTNKKKKQHQLFSRSPLQALNTATSNNSSCRSSSSIEAPRGRIRFFLSHSSSNSNTNMKTPFINRPRKEKALTETPKSAPNPLKPTSINASKHKKLSVLSSSGSPVNKPPPGRTKLGVCSVSDVNFTPLSKIATGSGLDFAADKKVTIGDEDEKMSNTSGNSNKTPPIQASVSPEIQTQCGGSALASKTTTPACYAAGYIVSGVTDKRKCRSRGILTVGDNNLLDFDMVPLPAEASIHWLLSSPCNSENGLCRRRGEADSDIDGEISPFTVDPLGSGNVIQTPQSDSSTDRFVGLSWLKTASGQKHRLDSELDLVTESFQMMSLSSKGYESISSFQPPSNSVDHSQFQKILDDRASWMSTSTLDNLSQSQMRISWREGLVSQMFEMDEFDSCRYLSDEEEDANGCHNNDQLKSCQNPELNVDAGNYEIPKIGSRSTEFVDRDLETEEKGDKRSHPLMFRNTQKCLWK
ncbi:hypothetical protein Dsin_003959 [Dipteronia sinensis]|uniref:Uncharacterized protein n=1 Tax=Dipteronia sinensis TaxID=43782 RepID=A0AAE0B8N3_9ROSI|nr:hypothetical protein Dsin_003959 [Dipteronia sinensis]